MTVNLATLINANVVCHECGSRYGKYSVGCSSVWAGTCNVCGEDRNVTEVRDYGYLQKGIDELKGNVKQQSKKVADYMETVGPCIVDDILDTPHMKDISYEVGDIACWLTKDEIAFLNECLDTIIENHVTLSPGHTCEDPDDIKIFENIERKITDLYEDNCITFDLSPAMKAYNKKYGTWGMDNELDMARWEGFRDAFVEASND